MEKRLLTIYKGAKSIATFSWLGYARKRHQNQVTV
jgi:hypothetical protein